MRLFGMDEQAKRRLTDGSIQTVLDRQPLARFPARLAVVRVQAPDYCSYSTEGYGWGRYTVVTTRDIADEEHLERLARMPQVAGVAPINRLLIPAELQSDRELREAAASLHADMLLIYTLDTTFETLSQSQPLNILVLGLLPDREITITTTAAAVVMDTRTGYVYGVAEGTERDRHAASAWTKTAIVDQARRDTEREALDEMIDEVVSLWPHIVLNHAPYRASRVSGLRYRTVPPH